MLPTSAIASTSPRAAIEAAYWDVYADLDALTFAANEARDAFRDAPCGAECDAALVVLDLARGMKAYAQAEFDRLFSIMADLPEIEDAAETDAADQFALAL